MQRRKFMPARLIDRGFSVELAGSLARSKAVNTAAASSVPRSRKCQNSKLLALSPAVRWSRSGAQWWQIHQMHWSVITHHCRRAPVSLLSLLSPATPPRPPPSCDLSALTASGLAGSRKCCGCCVEGSGRSALNCSRSAVDSIRSQPSQQPPPFGGFTFDHRPRRARLPGGESLNLEGRPVRKLSSPAHA